MGSEHFPGSMFPTVLGQPRTRDAVYPLGSSLKKWTELFGENRETSSGISFSDGSYQTPVLSYKPPLWDRVSPSAFWWALADVCRATRHPKRTPDRREKEGHNYETTLQVRGCWAYGRRKCSALLCQEVLKMAEKALEEGNNQRARQNQNYKQHNKFKEALVGSEWRKLP